MKSLLFFLVLDGLERKIENGILKKICRLLCINLNANLSEVGMFEGCVCCFFVLLFFPQFDLRCIPALFLVNETYSELGKKSCLKVSGREKLLLGSSMPSMKDWISD